MDIYRILRITSPWANFLTSTLNRGVGLKYIVGLYKLLYIYKYVGSLASPTPGEAPLA